ncbi:MAG: TonB-dependent receptor, partial [Bacteroidota bacterium]
MKNTLFLLGLLLWTAAAGAQTNLFGSISDANGEPLPGANIVLDNTEYGTIADSDGFFIFFNLEAGEYEVVVSYLGYQTIRQKAVVTKGQKTEVEITLAAATYEIKPIEIQGAWVDEQTPITYSNVGRETIEKRNLGQDVPFLLRWTPSTVVTSDAGTGIGYTGIRIRGTDPTRINVSINGIPLNDAESQGVFWVNLPDFASSTDQVQIHRGVGTSTNGAGAFGATINLSTTQIHTEPYATTAHTFGSFNTVKNNITAGSGLINDRFTLDGRWSRISSDGFIDRGSADLNSFYFSGAYLGERQSLRFNVFSGHEVTYQAWNGVPVQFEKIDSLRSFNPSGTEKPGDPHDNEVDDYRQTHYQLLYHQQLGSQWNLELAGHYTRGKGFFELYQAGEVLSQFNVPVEDDALVGDLIERRWLDNHFYGLTYGLGYQTIDERAQITIGGAANRYDGQHYGEIIWSDFTQALDPGPRYYDNDARKIDFNIYTKLNYRWNDSWNTYLDLQYRFVDYEFLGINDDRVRITQSEQLHFFNPKLGVGYNLNDRSRFYLAFGVANREPNRDDYTEANPGSRPEHETLYNVELGYRQKWERATLGINSYLMYYHDQLVPTGQINDVGAYTRRNVESSYRVGIEIDGQVALTDALQLGGSLTLSRNKIDAFSEFIDSLPSYTQGEVMHENTDLAFSPSVISAVEISYELLRGLDNQSLSLALSNKFISDQFIDNTSNEQAELDAYTFTDFRLNYHLTTKPFKDIAITLLVRNIFNSKFSTNAWVYRFFSPDDP